MNLTNAIPRLGSYNVSKYSTWRWVMVVLLWAQVSIANANLWESLTGQKPQGPLPVEEAYLFSYSQPKPGLLILQWTMPESDYYLYRDQVKLHTDGQADVVAIQKGPTVEKKDAIYGQSQVYYNEAEIRVAVQQSAAGNPDAEIRVEYQGCWEGASVIHPRPSRCNLFLSPLKHRHSLHPVQALNPPSLNPTRSNSP